MTQRELALSGENKISWVRHSMPVLEELEFRIPKTLFAGKKIGIVCHAEAKTAALALTLHRLGAEVYMTGSNPLTTKDDVIAYLKEMGVHAYGKFGCTMKGYKDCIRKIASQNLDLFIDDGGDLTEYLRKHSEYCKNLIGGAEQTTTGINRLRQLEKDGQLFCPMVLTNDAKSKHLLDNVYGTGESVWSAIMIATNNMIAGKYVVVAGYGHCGRGVALRAKGLGAKVIVTEIDPHKALEAYFEGYQVMTMEEASSVGDIFVTVTGESDVIREEHLMRMKDQVILANAGHFDVEISKKGLNHISDYSYEAKPFITSYVNKDGSKTWNLLSEGRLVNISAGMGHPAEVMDTSFAAQLLALKYLLQAKQRPGLYNLPEYSDRLIAYIKLHSLGIHIDSEEGSAL